MINFIVNVKSGRGNGEKAFKICTDICLKKGINFAAHITQRPGHATEYAEKICAAGGDLIVAIGGDGTFHETLNGVDTARAAVGFIPAGRGNDFARAAGLSLNPEKAFADVLRGEKKQIDYIQVGEKRCLNIAGTGMDVDVLQAVYGKTGFLTYYASLLSAITKFKPYDMRIKFNGETVEKSCIMVGICNGTSFGGGIKLSPDSKIDDGKLDLIIMEKKERSLLKILPKFKKGKHMDFPETTHYVVDEVEIVNRGLHGEENAVRPPIELDGEIYSELPFNCRVIKGGLTTFAVK